MKKLLLLFHPNINNSVANKYFTEKLAVLPEIEIVNLYQLYPDYRIDVKQQQQLLMKNDLVIFLFPIHWNGAPSMFKKWEEDVLELNWAFGNEFALENKAFIVLTTTDSRKEDYRPLGRKGFYYQTMIKMNLTTLKHIRAKVIYNYNLFFKWNKKEYQKDLLKSADNILEKIKDYEKQNQK